MSSIEQTSRELGDSRRLAAKLITQRESIVSQLAIAGITAEHQKQLTLEYNNLTVDAIVQLVAIDELELQLKHMRTS